MVFFACQPESNELQKKQQTEKLTNANSDEWSHLEKNYLIDTIVTFDAETYKETIEMVKTPYYKEVDQMPTFGDNCIGMLGEERTECSNKNMLTHIYNNIKW